MHACEHADDELVALLHETEERMRVLMHQQLDIIAEAERRGLFSHHGARNTKAWLQDLLRLSPGDAASRTKVARAVEDRRTLTGEEIPPDLPETAAALGDGAIGLEHARVISEGIRKLPPQAPRDQRAETEALLAAHARRLPPHQVRILADRVRYQLDQDGALRDEQYQVENRELLLATGRDGMTVLKGRLDKETGAKLRALLVPLAKPRPQEDGEPDPRSAGKRNADAFETLLDLAAASRELPTSGGSRPQITVTIDYDSLTEQLPFQHGSPGTITTTGEPISAELARKLACDAEILPIVISGDSQPLNIGRAQRTAPPHLRAALIARDGTCAFPGCDQPPGTSEAHHIAHWADGGETNRDNMIMLCAAHHRILHSQHWQARINHQGRPEFIPPRWIDPTQQPRPGGKPLHQHQLALVSHART